MNEYYQVQGYLKAEIKNLEWLSRSFGEAIAKKDDDEITKISKDIEDSQKNIDKKMNKLALIANDYLYRE